MLSLKEKIFQSLIGSWKVVSYQAQSESGGVLFPYSASPCGLLVYTTEGMMSAQIMNPERPHSDRVGTESDFDLRKIYNGYISYFGKFSVSDDGESVIHHVLGSLQPHIIGTDQVRSIKLRGDELILSASLLSGRKSRLHEIVWRKI